MSSSLAASSLPSSSRSRALSRAATAETAASLERRALPGDSSAPRPGPMRFNLPAYDCSCPFGRSLFLFCPGGFYPCFPGGFCPCSCTGGLFPLLSSGFRCPLFCSCPGVSSSTPEVLSPGAPRGCPEALQASATIPRAVWILEDSGRPRRRGTQGVVVRRNVGSAAQSAPGQV
ncbi:hypothetical protein HDK64DRAFT_265588 [Phyllosticta capitalensis]